jgi:hypothetical protein
MTTKSDDKLLKIYDAIDDFLKSLFQLQKNIPSVTKTLASRFTTNSDVASFLKDAIQYVSHVEQMCRNVFDYIDANSIAGLDAAGVVIDGVSDEEKRESIRAWISTRDRRMLVPKLQDQTFLVRKPHGRFVKRDDTVSKNFISDIKLLVSRLDVDDVMEKARELHDLLPARAKKKTVGSSYMGFVGVARGLTRKKRKKRKKTKRRR